ncbi:amino acid ABC transporter substrate-binding protein [Periweissella beninensis]|uniref:Amino acid ABC transporter substrate-binding protein n=1 Tax=Periweissella beninensis TaxID=504936 RepID=A0ABT0VJY2_9LACO|nr:amino acid ABC transporter substrate-binding protein [Periweissella beninensis]MCM2436717.1 amino acid ABC transporter substrate-binding protein [Periweissella beninensis]MCT4395683.1 amino acid ABC transporter substrate-binding protein [Periweissella beninensis]
MKKKGIMTILIGLATIVWLYIIVGNGLSIGHNFNKSDNWTRYTQSKTITIGLDDTFVPMGFRNNKGQIVGYDIDLTKAVFKKYGIKPIFQPIDWSMKETELRNGTIDLIWNGYSKTAQRAKVVAFSKAYFDNSQVLVTLKKDNIKKFSDMKNKVLGVQTASSGQTALDAQPKVLKQYIANQQPILYDTFMNAVNDLQSGRIKGVLIDRVYANYYLSHQKNGNQYRIVEGTFAPDYFVVGLRKSDTTLQKKINNALAEMQKSGELQAITKKWFGTSKSK